MKKLISDRNVIFNIIISKEEESDSKDVKQTQDEMWKTLEKG